MQLGRVVGRAIATIKHESLERWRLLLVQPLDMSRRPDGEPLLVLDNLGARAGDMVVLSSDGRGARELVGAEKSPARWFVAGIADHSR
jgi:ethanolamine utilization protein EutN